MKLINHLQEGFLNLLTAKLRSFLALLGILVGTASVVAMVSGGKLATNEALKQFKVLGTDLLAVTISSNLADHSSEEKQQNLTLDKTYQLRDKINNIDNLAPYIQVYSPIQYEAHELHGVVLGVTNNFANIAHVYLKKGRNISEFDGYSFFCVIGNSLAAEIKKITFKEPLGQQLQVGKNFFTIIGIAKAWPENSFVYASVDHAVMIPILTSMALSKFAVINNIIVRLQPAADIEKVKNHITTYINQNFANKRLFFHSPQELISGMQKQSQIFTIFLGLIGSISLMVGGIGVMNIMLVSVVERRTEIGIRLAVGATRADIRLLFLMEALLLSLIGGILGVIIGILIAYVMTLCWHWSFTFFILPPVIGFIISVAIGIFFGFYPAYQASQLNPIQALRSSL